MRKRCCDGTAFTRGKVRECEALGQQRALARRSSPPSTEYSILRGHHRFQLSGEKVHSSQCQQMQALSDASLYCSQRNRLRLEILCRAISTFPPSSSLTSHVSHKISTRRCTPFVRVLRRLPKISGGARRTAVGVFRRLSKAPDAAVGAQPARGAPFDRLPEVARPSRWLRDCHWLARC